MGIFFLQMSELSGPYGPPPFMAIIPFGMGVLGLFILFSVLRASGQQKPSDYRYKSETIVYTGDYTTSPESSGEKRKGKTVYQVPSTCPSCGAGISNDEVDWIGPLQAKCPYCGATFEAEERRF